MSDYSWLWIDDLSDIDEDNYYDYFYNSDVKDNFFTCKCGSSNIEYDGSYTVCRDCGMIIEI